MEVMDTATYDPAAATKTVRRAKAREKKARQRQHRRERQILSAQQEAQRQEEIAERAAPAIMRAPIFAQDGTMLIGARIEIVNGRAHRADPIAASKSKAFSNAHKKAARRLQQDWHDVGAGIGSGALDYLRTSGARNGVGLDVAVLEQIHTRRRLEAAMAHLGAFAPAIARVVLDCVPIAVWVQEPDPTRSEPRTLDEGIAWLAAGLGRLATHYWPPAPPTDGGIRVLAPERAAYEVRIGGDSR